METFPPKRKLRWYQFSLRSLMVAVTLVCLAAGWFGMKVRAAQQQQAAVAAIEEMGGNVEYDCEYDSNGNWHPSGSSSGPSGLRALLGDDFFRNVYRVSFRGFGESAFADANLNNITVFAKIKCLDLHGTRVTDAGLEQLKELSQLEWLSLDSTQTSAAGVAKLQEALPSCQIDR